MADAPVLAEIRRGAFVESRHRGHAVVADAAGTVLAAWGDPDMVILPRSAIKMLQALPLVESGAAGRAGLGPRHLALAAASHQGAALHVGLVADWLKGIGLSEAALFCGPQPPADRAERQRLRATGTAPDQRHNNCSGKHAGFLTLARHLRAGPDYIAADHPVQAAVREALEAMTSNPSPGWAVDGCSAPNFAARLSDLARAMARMARPAGLGPARAEAAARLVAAMRDHPDLVAGTGRACTELIRAARGRAVVKTGAEGVFTAILPDRGLGVALKIEDGATRAAEIAITAILVRAGVLDGAHPAVARRLRPPVENRRGIVTGAMGPSVALWQDGRPLG